MRLEDDHLKFRSLRFNLSVSDLSEVEIGLGVQVGETLGDTLIVGFDVSIHEAWRRLFRETLTLLT